MKSIFTSVIVILTLAAVLCLGAFSASASEDCLAGCEKKLEECKAAAGGDEAKLAACTEAAEECESECDQPAMHAY